jgi:hypothetical protein
MSDSIKRDVMKVLKAKDFHNQNNLDIAISRALESIPALSDFKVTGEANYVGEWIKISLTFFTDSVSAQAQSDAVSEVMISNAGYTACVNADDEYELPSEVVLDKLASIAQNIFFIKEPPLWYFIDERDELREAILNEILVLISGITNRPSMVENIMFDQDEMKIHTGINSALVAERFAHFYGG